MFIKSVDVNTKDVFLGKGWDNWVRFWRNEKGQWLRVKGLKLPKETHDRIVARLDSAPPYLDNKEA